MWSLRTYKEDFNFIVFLRPYKSREALIIKRFSKTKEEVKILLKMQELSIANRINISCFKSIDQVRAKKENDSRSIKINPFSSQLINAFQTVTGKWCISIIYCHIYVCPWKRSHDLIKNNMYETIWRRISSIKFNGLNCKRYNPVMHASKHASMT